jgi:hypothetical protein
MIQLAAFARFIELQFLLSSGQALLRDSQPGYLPFAICHLLSAIGNWQLAIRSEAASLKPISVIRSNPPLRMVQRHYNSQQAL